MTMWKVVALARDIPKLVNPPMLWEPHNFIVEYWRRGHEEEDEVKKIVQYQG
jgi:hypothetical protein